MTIEHRGRGRPKFLIEQFPGLLTKYDAGATVIALAAEYGVSQIVVSRLLREAGRRIRHRGGRATPKADRNAAVAAACAGGRTMADVGREFGISFQRVQQIVSRAREDK